MKYLPVILVAVLFLSVLIWQAMTFIASAKKKKLRNDFIYAYANLKLEIRSSSVTKDSAISIMEQFNRLELNPEKEPQKIILLRADFEKKYESLLGAL
jgi:hypothetical protein